MFEAVYQTDKVPRRKKRETVQIAHERRVVSKTDAIRNPYAMVVEEVYTPVAVRTVIDLCIWSYRMTTTAFKLNLAADLVFSFGLDYPWVSCHRLVVEPFSHDQKRDTHSLQDL